MKMSQSTNNKQPFRKYMQEKLAITVLVMMLALIALTVILYTMVQNKNEDYTQVVLSHQDYDSRTIPYRRETLWIGTDPTWPPARRCTL